MKKVLVNILKMLIILLVIAWIGILFFDYFNTHQGKEPRFCIKEETKVYDDGTVYICTGLGYKLFKYDRKSISAFEFGPFFLQERNS